MTDLLNMVLEDLSPKVVDTVMESVVGFQWLQNRISSFGGASKTYAIKYKKAGNGSSFSGFDVASTNYVNTTAKLEFRPAYVRQSIVFSDTELTESKTDAAIIDLMTFKMEEAEQELVDLLGGMVYGDGTGNGGKDLSGFAAAVKTSGSYGGLSYATYTTLQSTVDSSTNLAGLTLAKLDAMYSALSSGNEQPDVIFTTKAIYNKLAEVLPTPTYITNAAFDATANKIVGRKRAALGANVGFNEIYYKGIPVIEDEKCTAGHLYMLTSKTWELAVIDMVGGDDGYSPIKVATSTIEGQYDTNLVNQPTGFSKSKFVRNHNQSAVGAFIVFGGQIICKNPKRNGKFTNLS